MMLCPELFEIKSENRIQVMTLTSCDQSLSIKDKPIAYIQASWHSDIVEQCYIGLSQQLKIMEFDVNLIDRYTVAGSLEIPLQAKKLANANKYSLIIAAGLIVDGGIYRHDFVANAVLQGMMDVQLQCDIPILSVVLTPHSFHEHQTHQTFFKEHLFLKGKEAATACIQTLENLGVLSESLGQAD